MTRKRVYIAGPISKGCLQANLNQATAAFVALAKAGFAPMCPHWSAYSKPAAKCPDTGVVSCVATIQGNTGMGHADWLGIDLPWVAVADAVLRLPGESVGADMEVKHAQQNGIPVFATVDEVVTWAATR